MFNEEGQAPEKLITESSANMGVFRCPRCGETIYSDAEECRFCLAPVDRLAAIQGAQLQAEVNNACNQAKLVRNSAGVMWVFLAFASLPMFALFGWAVLGLLIGIPGGLLYWQARFGHLETSDPDYHIAKRDSRIAFFIWFPAVVLVALSFLFSKTW